VISHDDRTPNKNFFRARVKANGLITALVTLANSHLNGD